MKNYDVFWAVWNDKFGFYVDTRLTRSEMVEKHTHDLGRSWDECKKNGDKVIKVKLVPVKTKSS
jgi:pectin methylesterase-like acyl-CoA thioesterase